VDQDQPVVGLHHVDVDRAQPVHRKRQRDPVHTRCDRPGSRLGPVVGLFFHHVLFCTSPRPVIGGTSLASTSPPAESQTACTALTTRIAVTIIPDTLWSACLAEITTSAPASASAAALPAPIPRPAPVTMATFPSTLKRSRIMAEQKRVLVLA